MPHTPRSSYPGHQQAPSYRDSPRLQAARPNTLPLTNTTPGSPAPSRPIPPRDAYYHTPQKQPSISKSDSKSYQSLTGGGERGGATPRRQNSGASSAARPYSYHGPSAGGSLGPQGDDPTPPPLPNPPAHYSPLKLTQYDKDVAMYKAGEPPSQVSSSTDSGYGHAHIYERVPADQTGRSSLTPGGNGSQAFYHRPSPSKDSALGSRESTPGSLTTPGSMGAPGNMGNQPRPAPEGQRTSDGCIDDSQLRIVSFLVHIFNVIIMTL